MPHGACPSPPRPPYQRPRPGRDVRGVWSAISPDQVLAGAVVVQRLDDLPRMATRQLARRGLLEVEEHRDGRQLGDRLAFVDLVAALLAKVEVHVDPAIGAERQGIVAAREVALGEALVVRV